MAEEHDPNDNPVKPNDNPVDQLVRVQQGKADYRHSLGLLLICAAIYVPQMGIYGMFDPWETHYTEVGRQFMVRDNWLATYWHNGTGPEGWAETNFWSKPVGSFWMSGLSLKLFGFDGATGEQIANGNIEWAVRLPFFLCALFGIFCVYLMCARLFNRRTGLLAGVILATAPMYFMIGRQAMTDMPYVGMISGGLALFILALFGEKEELPRRSARIARWTISWPHHPTYYLFIACFVAFMALTLTAIIEPLLRVPLRGLGNNKISAAAVMLIYVVLTIVLLWSSRKTKTRNEVYLYGFYMVTGIAGLAKGLIGALQPGMVIFVYLLASREWRMLTEVALGRGLLIAGCVFAPWYHGMLLRFGGRFWNDLFGTEQLRRLTIGEQAQAKGTFEYYINQTAYGLFPWVAFLPAALVRAFGIGMQKQRSPRDRARLFIYCWFVGALALFTLTLTKYHHYILPVIPPAAILIALFLDDLLEGKVRTAPVLLMASGLVLLMVTIDLVTQPAHWVWMFTYLYTSNWAQGVPGWKPILYYAIAFALPLLLLFVPKPKLRQIAVVGTAAVAIVVGGLWPFKIELAHLKGRDIEHSGVAKRPRTGFGVLNWYLVGCAPNWSQKRVIQTYYAMRKGPEEQLIAWQFNWRGETWYTGAQVVVSKSLDNKKIIDWLKKPERAGRRFFFITERSRFSSLRNMLPTPKGKKTLKIVDDSNVHYVLAAAEI